MAAAAHDPEFAARAGISQSVAQEFNQADKGSALLSRAMRHRGRTKRSPLHRLMHAETNY